MTKRRQRFYPMTLAGQKVGASWREFVSRFDRFVAFIIGCARLVVANKSERRGARRLSFSGGRHIRATGIVLDQFEGKNMEMARWRASIRLWLIVIGCWAVSVVVLGETPRIDITGYPPLKDIGPVESYGANIQRTMTLLATSTPERRRSVKILFYGQSITEQDWWKSVADDLRRRYPHADLQIENRAIGGFASQMLVKTAATDVYPFYPDLVILHAYGSHLGYEELIRGIRSRTTAEVLLQTDHLSLNDALDEPTDAAALTPARWTPWMNASFLPSMASKYRLELVNQRELWKRHLNRHHLSPSALLNDGTHLNEHGCFVMSSIVGAYLRYRPELPDGQWRDSVRDFEVGRDVQWRDGKLRLTFDGNRVDALMKTGGGSPAQVEIDGKHPAELAEPYARTPATPFPETKWPCLLESTNASPLKAEEWTLTLHDVAEDMSTFRFRVRGSQTGPDGEGRNDQRFVSPSGRVVIDPDDWNLSYAREVFGRSVGEGFEIRWRVIPQFVDRVFAPGDVDPTRETTVTIAQGLAPGRHILELTGGTDSPIAAIRVYRPPYTNETPRSARRIE